MVYQTEKTLKDLGDKVSAEDKAEIEEKAEALKKIKDGEDTEAIKKATEELTEAFYAVSSKIYSADQGAEGAAGVDPNAAAGGASAEQVTQMIML